MESLTAKMSLVTAWPDPTVNIITICNAVKHVNEKYKLLCDNVYHPEFIAMRLAMKA